MARSTMGTVLTDLRNLINDAAGTAQVWTDDQLQFHLDRHRLDVYFMPLEPVPTYTGGGSVSYFEYRSPYRDYEATMGGTAVFVVEDGLGENVSAASYTADTQNGIVTFTANTGGTAYYLTARSYDLYGAAGDVCEAWAQKVALEFDFSTDGQSFSRSQKAAMLSAQAERFRRKARRATSGSKVTRDDLAPQPTTWRRRRLNGEW